MRGRVFVKILGISTASNLTYFYTQNVLKIALRPSWEGIQLLHLSNFVGDFQIFIDGSKSNEGVGSTFCCFNNIELIFSWKSHSRRENFVFQEELKTIQGAIE